MRICVAEIADVDVVGGKDAVAIVMQEFFDELLAAVVLVLGIGAAQHFVHDYKKRRALFEAVDNALEAFQLRKKIRLVVLHRIGCADARQYFHGRKPELRRADHRTDLGEDEINANGAQVSAFARHVCTRKDGKERTVAKIDVVAHHLCRVEQWMASGFGV